MPACILMICLIHPLIHPYIHQRALPGAQWVFMGQRWYLEPPAGSPPSWTCQESLHREVSKRVSLEETVIWLKHLSDYLRIGNSQPGEVNHFTSLYAWSKMLCLNQVSQSPLLKPGLGRRLWQIVSGKGSNKSDIKNFYGVATSVKVYMALLGKPGPLPVARLEGSSGRPLGLRLHRKLITTP